MKSAILAILLVFSLAGFCAGADQDTTAGTYISKKDSKEYLILHPDGSFALKQRRMPPSMENPFVELTGKYSVKGEELTLKLPDGGEATGKLAGNTFEDSEGVVWIKEGSQRFELKRPTGGALGKHP